MNREGIKMDYEYLDYLIEKFKDKDLGDDISFTQKVFDIISDVLPNEWKKAVFVAYYLPIDSSYTMKLFYQDSTGKYVQKKSFKLFEIDKILTKVRKKLDKKHKWYGMTLVVTNDGHMKLNYDYEDHSENMFGYEENWMKRYLK